MIKDRREAFLAAEKRRQAALKGNGRLFSEATRADGPYSAPTPKNPTPHAYSFCLPIATSEENLFEEARSQVAAFREKKIPWHKGVGGRPTTHLCSSQVCCVNFLAPLADIPDALLRLVKKTYPGAVQMLPVDPKGTRYVEFEWIGDPSRDYLDEAGKHSGVRTRGANCTSADAAVRYRDGDGLEHVVLIEWKYCESYRDLASIPSDRRLLADVEGVPTSSGLTRRGRYEHRLDEVVDLPEEVIFDDLCVEPLYQLMRQQLLAHEMETEGKEAATVSVLHLAPRANHDFARITSPAVREWAAKEYAGEDLGVTEAWRRLLKHRDRFEHRYIEDWFAPLLADPDPVLAQWRAYIRARYSSVVGQRKRLYVDMDGVLADFESGAEASLQTRSSRSTQDNPTKSQVSSVSWTLCPGPSRPSGRCRRFSRHTSCPLPPGKTRPLGRTRWCGSRSISATSPTSGSSSAMQGPEQGRLPGR